MCLEVPGGLCKSSCSEDFETTGWKDFRRLHGEEEEFSVKGREMGWWKGGMGTCSQGGVFFTFEFKWEVVLKGFYTVWSDLHNHQTLSDYLLCDKWHLRFGRIIFQISICVLLSVWIIILWSIMERVQAGQAASPESYFGPSATKQVILMNLLIFLSPFLICKMIPILGFKKNIHM